MSGGGCKAGQGVGVTVTCAGGVSFMRSSCATSRDELEGQMFNVTELIDVDEESVNATENDSLVASLNSEALTSTAAPGATTGSNFLRNSSAGKNHSGNQSASSCGKIANSHEVVGKGCTCNHGYDLSIALGMQSGSAVVSRACIPAACRVNGSNHEAGLKCACAPGYDGDITWYGPTPFGNCTLKPCGDGYQWISSRRQCMPVPCDVQNSNRLAGPACACENGFEGGITWNGAEAHGKCNPLAEVIDSCHICGTQDFVKSNLNKKAGQICVDRRDAVVGHVIGE